MPNIHAIEFIYPTGAKLSLNDKSFREAIKFVLNGQFIKNTPIKVVFPTTKKVLYFDDDYFRSYIQENITQEELIELTQCDGLYRNKAYLNLQGYGSIDAGALWKSQKGELFLIDRDDLVSTKYDVDLFQEI
jgi:hypothetical protein